MKQWFVTVFFSTAIGCGVGLFFLWVLPQLHLPRQHQLYRLFGVNKPIVLGFQPYWLIAQADKDYAPYLTDVTYFGLVINGDGSVQKMVNPKEEEPGWTRLRSDAAKKLFNTAKTNQQLTSLLIHTAQEKTVEELIKSQKNAQHLLSEVEPLMKEYGFSDLNLDIETYQAASPSAQQAFTDFVREVKQGLEQKQLGTLTIEITPSSIINEQIIKPGEVGQVADRVVLMAYDFHYRGSFISGPVAPVNGADENREYDVETSLKFLTKVVSKDKILLGIPLYGYEWETLERYPQAPVIPGSGKVATNRRADELIANCVHCIKELDLLSLQPYLILPQTEEGYSQQIFYEDEESLRRKIELTNKYQLRGVALWAVGYEGPKMLEPLRGYKRSSTWLK